jgi:hypothetical protein
MNLSNVSEDGYKKFDIIAIHSAMQPHIKTYRCKLTTIFDDSAKPSTKLGLRTHPFQIADRVATMSPLSGCTTPDFSHLRIE